MTTSFDQEGPYNNHKTGDWYCEKCHTHNFARRENCFKCKLPKSGQKYCEVSEHEAGRYVNTGKSRGKRGDWNCSNSSCRYLNYASRMECKLCGTEKHEMPDEWTCPKCEFMNKAFREKCLKCATKNPDEKSLEQFRREGDWRCEDCGCYNFARRDSCFECRCPREESERQREVESGRQRT